MSTQFVVIAMWQYESGCKVLGVKDTKLQAMKVASQNCRNYEVVEIHRVLDGVTVEIEEIGWDGKFTERGVYL